MHKYVSEFLKQKNSNQLSIFLDVLEEKKEDSLFLMTKRGFYFYSIIGRALQRDRLLSRCRCFEDYWVTPQVLDQYQTIYLTGDTLSSGYQMFRYYCVLKKAAVNHRIVAVVYALSTEFPRDSLCESMYKIYYEIYGVASENQNGENREKAVCMWKNFKANLYCHRYLNQENISLFNLDETRLLQRTSRNFMNTFIASDDYRIVGPAVVVQEKLKLLCQDTTEWRYVSLNMADISDKTFDTGIQLGYFEYHGSQDSILHHPLLINSIVLCKFWAAEEDTEPAVVFSPLAIGRSCTKAWLLENFYKTIRNVFPDEREREDVERLCGGDLCLMYRMLLCIYSLQIGAQFQRCLREKRLPVAKYAGGVADLPFANVILEQEGGAEKTEILSPVQKKQPREATHAEFPVGAVCHMVKNEILRRESNKNIPVSPEDIEEFLQENRFAKTSDVVKDLLTGVLLLLTETGICGNEVFMTGGTVGNAFIPEENANFMLSNSEVLCHICADVLYISWGVERFKQERKSFLDRMNTELNDMGIFEDNLKEEIYSDYALMLAAASTEDIKYKILGKRFLVRNLCGLLKDVQERAIQNAEEL